VRVPHIDLVDSTWIAAAPARVADEVALAANWARWWPRLTLTVIEARGPAGMRWTVRGDGLTGEMEIWLQPQFEGVIVHYFVRADATDTAGGWRRPRRRRRIERAWRGQAKRAFWALGDALGADQRA
jgi:hypothetical protein